MFRNNLYRLSAFRKLLYVFLALVMISNGTTLNSFAEAPQTSVQSVQHAKRWSTVQLRARLDLPHGQTAYVSKIEISGFNQHDQWASNTWSQTSWTKRTISAPRWWWKVGQNSAGVIVRLYLDGYGWRRCNGYLKLVENPPYFTDWATVIYRGNGQCDLWSGLT